MTSAFFQILKIGFQKRLLVYALVVISAIFANLIINPVIQLFWLLVLVLSAEIFMFCITRTLFDNLIMSLRHRGLPHPIPDEIKQLSEQMGIKLKEFRVSERFDNAYTNGNDVVIGDHLLQSLKKDELMAVIAHEFAHIKEYHLPIRFVSIMPLFFIVNASFNHLPPLLQSIAALAYLMVVMIPLNWYLEIRADRLAAKYVDGCHLSSALMVLNGGRDMKEGSESHPPIKTRILLLAKNQ
jgi:heat shock protein HtpX